MHATQCRTAHTPVVARGAATISAREGLLFGESMHEEARFRVLPRFDRDES